MQSFENFAWNLLLLHFRLRYPDEHSLVSLYFWRRMWHTALLSHLFTRKTVKLYLSEKYPILVIFVTFRNILSDKRSCSVSASTHMENLNKWYINIELQVSSRLYDSLKQINIRFTLIWMPNASRLWLFSQVSLKSNFRIYFIEIYDFTYLPVWDYSTNSMLYFRCQMRGTTVLSHGMHGTSQNAIFRSNSLTYAIYIFALIEVMLTNKR